MVSYAEVIGGVAAGMGLSLARSGVMKIDSDRFESARSVDAYHSAHPAVSGGYGRYLDSRASCCGA